MVKRKEPEHTAAGNDRFGTRVLPLGDSIFRYAVSLLSDTVRAQDATQDVMEKLWSMRDTLPYDGNLRGFVYTIARNRCLDVLRRNGRRKEIPPEAVYPGIRADDDPGRQAELLDMKEIVRCEIAALPEKQQLVMHLRDIEGCEFDEIVSITGMTEPVARVMLSRARKAVREKLIKTGTHGI